MKKLKLTKVIASTLIVASVLALNPIGASAEWKQSYRGWWYTEGSSWATGWRLIDSKWYYFDSSGYMAKNTTIDGCYLNSNGVWTELTTSGNLKFDKSTGTIVDYIGSENSVVIPGKIDGIDVKNISFRASPNLKGLTSITIQDGITSIGSYAFIGCSSLKSIILPNSLESIGTKAFYGCSSLTSITIPNSVTSINPVAFGECSSLTNINIPNGITHIYDEEFRGCSSLTNITIPDSVTIIEHNAFSECSSLKNITLPNGVTTIMGAAFLNCSSLTSITIPNGVTTIGNYTFEGCSSLTSITIPDSVTSIVNDSSGPGPKVKKNLAFFNCVNAKFYVTSEAVKQLLINYGVAENRIILNTKS